MASGVVLIIDHLRKAQDHALRQADRINRRAIKTTAEDAYMDMYCLLESSARKLVKITRRKANAHDQDRFLDKEQLRKKLNLSSKRGVDELMRAKRIPFLRLGHRTVRFDWPKVLKALDQTEVKRGRRSSPRVTRA